MQVPEEQVNAAKAKKAHLVAISKELGFIELVEYMEKRKSSLQDVARDAVGIDPSSGKEVQIDPSMRLSSLDKAAGIDEILKYLERSLG